MRSILGVFDYGTPSMNRERARWRFTILFSACGKEVLSLGFVGGGELVHWHREVRVMIQWIDDGPKPHNIDQTQIQHNDYVIEWRRLSMHA